MSDQLTNILLMLTPSVVLFFRIDNKSVQWMQHLPIIPWAV